MHHILFSLRFIYFLFMSTWAEMINLNRYGIKDDIANTITVDPSGNGDFTTIQEAIDNVPSNNEAWTLIYVQAGIYNEKVNIRSDKPRICVQGESRMTTVVQISEGGNSIQSTTFSAYAEEFVAINITFKNNYNLETENPMTWAPAVLIRADKASFYDCGFISVQDTLTDLKGRHYFENCYIEGVVDFIWGNGQSIYQSCIINITTSIYRRGGTGYITAQARADSMDTSGFVFKNCSIVGTGPVFLGRAYRPYSRVLFYGTYMSDLIVPQGWSAWENVGIEDTIFFAEAYCEGPGVDMSKRVAWEKKVSSNDLDYFITVDTFIDGGGWLDKQPKFGLLRR